MTAAFARPNGPILHLVAAAEWAARDPAADFAPRDFAREGFVHCTAGDAALLGVANRFYRGIAGEFLALTIDPAALGPALRWEGPVHPRREGETCENRPDSGPDSMESADLWPHVYSPLPLRAIRGIRPLLRGPDGVFAGFGRFSPF